MKLTTLINRSSYESFRNESTLKLWDFCLVCRAGIPSIVVFCVYGIVWLGNTTTLRECLARDEYIPNQMNIKHNSLIDPKNVILPSLHIELGLMKNVLKALDRNGSAFKYLKNIFPNLSDAKLKEGIFVGPQIRKIFKDENFDNHLSYVEKDAWYSFQAVVKQCLSNIKTEDYEEIVNNSQLLTRNC